MRIAVISDTHGWLPKSIATAISTADEIWHLGDVTDENLFAEICDIGPPVRVVRGNCDECSDWEFSLDFEMEGFQIHLVHISPQRPPPKTDLLFHGHTHVPRDEVIGGIRFLNPGCISRPNRGAPASYGWLELVRGEPVKWELVPASEE